MTATIRIILGVLILGLAGVGAYLLLSSSSSSSSLDINSPTEPTETYTLDIDGFEREFIVYRPADLPADQQVPVVFMYHGYSGTGDKFYNISGWKEQAEAEGFMAVFPTAMKYHLIRDGRAVHETRWSSYQSGVGDFDPAYPDQTLADDVAFTRAMVDFLIDNYAIDSSRLYVTGFSNGGNMMNRLLNEMSDVFAAYANSSAGLSQAAVEEAGAYPAPGFVPRPVIALLGSTDPMLTESVGVEVFPTGEAIMDEGSVVRVRSIDAYLALLGLSDDYTYNEQGRISQFTFSEARDGSASDIEFQFLMASGMNHVLPNGKNYPLVAAEVYWEFFENYSLN